MSLENTILNSEKWYLESSRIRVLGIERQNTRGMTAAYGRRAADAVCRSPGLSLLHCSIVVILNLPLPLLLNGFIMVFEWCPWALPHSGFSLKGSSASPVATATPSLCHPPRARQTSSGSPGSIRALSQPRVKITLVTLAPSLFYFGEIIFNRDQFWGLIYNLAVEVVLSGIP